MGSSSQAWPLAGWLLVTPLAFIAYQLCSLHVLCEVHPICHAIANGMKRIVVLGAGALCMAEPLSWSFVAGALIALVGVTGFAITKHLNLSVVRGALASRTEGERSLQRLLSVGLHTLLLLASALLVFTADAPGAPPAPPSHAALTSPPQTSGVGTRMAPQGRRSHSNTSAPDSSGSRHHPHRHSMGKPYT